MTTILIVFGIAAVGGSVLALQRLRGAEQPSLPLAVVHGVLAATGVVMLLLVVMRGQAVGFSVAALALFVVAALGGAALFVMHLMKKALPIPLMVIHAVVAVAGFALLLATALTVSS